MDAIREQMKKPLVVGIVCGVIGLIIGWFVIGWGLWPVSYYDAAPSNLRADEQENYLRMAIDSYAVNGDVPMAQKRWTDLGSTASKVLEQIKANPGSEANAITPFENVVTGTSAQVPGVTQTPAPTKGKTSTTLLTVLGIMCVVTLLLGGALAAFFLLRGKGRPTGEATPAMQAQEAARQAPMTDYAAMGEEPPMAQFMASYKLGDDLFDDSFSIDSPAGEFMGECGVGISDTIGVGDPKKVTAFEVWLFDKNDIQTVTKVLMSAHAFGDETIRQRLAAKGEPILAQPGQQVVLETATLQLVSRVVDMAYGEGALPGEIFFDEMILELAVWKK